MPVIHDNVVTYAHAYLTGTIELCPDHAVDGHPTTDSIFGSLGPVQYGAHRGECRACVRELQREIAANDRSHGSVR